MVWRKNRISYLRENGAINDDGTLKTSIDIASAPSDSEIFMGVEFQILKF